MTLNHTVPNVFAEYLYVATVPLDLPSQLPEDTFLVVNNATGATDRILFTDSVEDLDSDYLVSWLRYGTYLVPRSEVVSTTTHFYLSATEEEGTFVVEWHTPGGPARRQLELDGRKIELTSHL